MRTILTIAVLVAAASAAFAADPFAPAAHVAPVAKSALDTSLYPIPQAQVAAYLQHLTQGQTYYNFSGQNPVLKAKSADDPNKMLVVGQGLTVDLGPETLFQAPFADGEYQVFLGAVTSADAQDIRLQVDLSALADEEELWLTDPVGQRHFGPYTRADQVEEGRWLPTVEGDTAVVMVRSLRTDLPQVRVLTLSHFFRSLDELKELDCNINVACEDDATIQEISSAVGIMVVPTSGGDAALCSGTLINNPDTADFEPYYITANHCVPGAASATQIDIIWDFRKATCDTSTIPSLSSLPRSNGESMLVTSSRLDCTLLELGSVPVGSYGRTYVGWDTSYPLIGDDCIVIHHPDGAYMRISYADIIHTNVSAAALGYYSQNQVQYPLGVTEGGSSGSCLLSTKLDYALIGTLSNGPTHICSNPDVNTDKFASFRRFFYDTNAKNYLSGQDNPIGPDCPTVVALKDNPEALKSLRTVRDRALITSPAGQMLVRAYYASAPTMASFLRRSDEARAAYAAVAGSMAQIAQLLMK